MSFGDPNNPYGQQQPPAPQGQPGYGYPQQAPQGVPPQGGYAYPQQQAQPGYGYPNQGYPAGPGGYAGAQMPMPGGVKAARVILFIVGGLQVLGGIVVLLGGALFASAFSSGSSDYSSSASDAGALAGGVIVGAGIFALALALWPILTAAKLSKGRGGVRVSGVVYGSLMTLFSGASLIINFVALGSDTAAGAVVFSLILALIQFGLALWVLVGLANSAAGAYFRRPQY
ncbi:hypothetical protein AB0M92_02265 [Streptomyces sp. NPDC051582]|uniref:proline-rich domain-containing protein n=1 Tax=Streptomyces sp. NPDC051582 TaxID=3155167 RepID=UPI003425146E